MGIEIRGVRRVFEDGGVVALDGIDLDIAQGEFVAILGPSGCGKSTLLRLIAGLDRPTSGTIEITAEKARGSAPGLAYVFQDAHLLPWRNVLRNTILPLELRGRKDKPAAIDALTQVGLSDFLKRYPAQLSGGMRMRVSLARALVTKPRLLLLDEPFAALDEITRQQLDDQLRALWKQHQMTIVFVTHSINEAAFLADRAIVMSPRPGRIVLDHKLDLPEDRAMSLRGEARFARECAILLDALHLQPVGAR